MYSISEITNKYKELAKSLGEEYNTPVMINGRLTRTLGRVISDVRNGKLFPRRIEISRQLLETATKESIDEVLIHEFCHWYLATTTHEDHGHDAVFKELCMRLGGGSGKTTTHVDRIVENSKLFKYQCFCAECGKELGHYSRAGKVIQYPERFYSYCCNADLKVVQNW